MAIKLTNAGIYVGASWYGADPIAKLAVKDWDRQLGHSFDSTKDYPILVTQTRLEIWYHAFFAAMGIKYINGHDTNPVNITFGTLPFLIYYFVS